MCRAVEAHVLGHQYHAVLDFDSASSLLIAGVAAGVFRRW